MAGNPGGTNRTVGDLVPGVIDYLQQRTDVTTLAPRYIKRALQEITESNPFEELRVTGPTVSLTTGQSTYPITLFLNSGDDYTSPESFTVYVDFPNNTVTGPINYKTPKAIETMVAPVTVGVPSRFTRYGNSFLIGPTPNNPYSVFLRYQRRHPFPYEAGQLSGAPIFIPDSWEEVVEVAAAHRIAVIKRWNDQADELHKILFGDPEAGMLGNGKMARPGLIQARLYQNERDSKFNTRQLGITTARYNPR